MTARRHGRRVTLSWRGGRVELHLFFPWVKRGVWGIDFCVPTATLRINGW